MRNLTSHRKSKRNAIKPSPRLRVEQLETRDVPTTSAAAYVVPSVSSVELTPIFTVGDEVAQPDGATGGVAGNYRMAGLPDGLGAYDNGDGTFTVLMNHEIGNTLGVTRDHGAKGSFVSKWVIEKATLNVVSGDDLIKTLYLWDAVNHQYVVGTGALAAISRLCSADLPDLGAFYNPATGLGTAERIFMNGEETSNGRAFAHVVTGADAGTSWELPWTGKYAWENHVASPFAQDKTVVVGLDDSRREFSSEGATDPSEVYVWVGNKQTTGLDIEKAGLVHGLLHGVRIGTPGAYDANEGTVTSGERFELVGLSDQTNNTTFTALQTESIANTITQFRRVEDGAWDPSHPNDFYFVTTDRFGPTGFSKLWRLRFDDITNPAAGGTIDIMVDGTGLGEMFDNIGMDQAGYVMLQEDIGNQAPLGKIWRFDTTDGTLTEEASHNAALFSGATPLTQDEESSGIIDVSAIFGEGVFLIDDQAHYAINTANPRGFANPNELVEGGQLLLMRTKIVTATLTAGVLTIQGTPYGDVINVWQQGNNYVVHANGKTVGSFARSATTQINVNGLGRNDIVIIDNNVKANSIIRGGKDNDILIAGGGSDVVLGEAGNDFVMGRGKADVLIGGLGSDILVGGAGGDILIAGTTAHDANDIALSQIAAEWSSGGSYATRINKLRNGLGVPNLDATTVFDDGVSDVLFGGAGRDWFFGSFATDWIFKTGNEQVN